MSGEKDDLTEARIRDAMQAIRERIVKPVTVGTRQFYVYDPTQPRADAVKKWRGEADATD